MVTEQRGSQWDMRAPSHGARAVWMIVAALACGCSRYASADVVQRIIANHDAELDKEVRKARGADSRRQVQASTVEYLVSPTTNTKADPVLLQQANTELAALTSRIAKVLADVEASRAEVARRVIKLRVKHLDELAALRERDLASIREQTAGILKDIEAIELKVVEHKARVVAAQSKLRQDYNAIHRKDL